MWKLLYHLSAPKYFYQRTLPWITWLWLSTLLILLVGVTWGLVFSPPDYQQGDAFRIIYIHVPCAMLSMALYAFMGFLAILLLVWRIKLAGILLRATARVGAMMTLLALVTGSLWGKPMWGTWWIWDARLTSEFILLFLYCALLALGHSWQNKEQGERMMAILALVGFIDLPIIHYSVYWWNTLHQGATLSLLAKPKIAPSMLYPLLVCFLGFSLYCITLILAKVHNELLLRERRRAWVKQVLIGSSYD